LFAVADSFRKQALIFESVSSLSLKLYKDGVSFTLDERKWSSSLLKTHQSQFFAFDHICLSQRQYVTPLPLDC
jgi:hypothetical protein